MSRARINFWRDCLFPTVLLRCSFTLVAVLWVFPQTTQQSALVADMCDNGGVESAAHLIFQDGVELTFVSNGHYYWFLNVTSDIPDVQSALKIPYGFKPDVAILKNTSSCSLGQLSLLLIQMKSSDDGSEAEWLTLEMKIGNWSANQTEPKIWGQVNKIAQCDLEAQLCTVTDNYFAAMSFDFKQKLNSAFGTIGETAYFVQGSNMFKVFYKNQCITNFYQEVIAYPAVPIGSTTTGALTILSHNYIVFFDNDVHIALSNQSLEDASFGDKLADIGQWQENALFFKQCPVTESTFSFLFMDVFSNSKRHHVKKQIILITSAAILAAIILLVLVIVVYNKLAKSRKGKDQPSNREANEEQLIEQPLDVQIKSSDNGEQHKTLLQTSC